MSRSTGVPTLVLDRTPPRVTVAPDLDVAQRSVVEHRQGPLLVLAGPGTGKTTTIVEALVDRLAGPGRLAASQVLALTFGRRAATELRDRVAARLGGGELPLVSTFHAFAYALLRQWSDRRQSRIALGRLNAHLVRDIGLDPLIAEAEAARPFWR